VGSGKSLASGVRGMVGLDAGDSSDDGIHGDRGMVDGGLAGGVLRVEGELVGHGPNQNYFNKQPTHLITKVNHI